MKGPQLSEGQVKTSTEKVQQLSESKVTAILGKVHYLYKGGSQLLEGIFTTPTREAHNYPSISL